GGEHYFDKVLATDAVESPEPIRITGETDRVYVNTEANCLVTDPGFAREIHIEKSGSRSTVIWNPWSEKARALADLGSEQWPHMLCVETANIGRNAVRLAPKETHLLTTIIRANRCEFSIDSPGAIRRCNILQWQR